MSQTVPCLKPCPCPCLVCALQGHKPHPRFMGQLRGLLAARLPGLRGSPSAVVVLLSGLSSLGEPLLPGRGGVLDGAQALLVGDRPRSEWGLLFGEVQAGRCRNRGRSGHCGDSGLLV